MPQPPLPRRPPLPIFLCFVPRPPPRSTLFPYTTLFRSQHLQRALHRGVRLIGKVRHRAVEAVPQLHPPRNGRSEEHTSELQSHVNLVCRLLLEKKNRRRRVACLSRSSRSSTLFLRLYLL